jgi:hypothetical protein
MLSSAEIARIKSEIGRVIGGNQASIAIRRGSTTLPAQNVRIERKAGGSRQVKSPGGEESRTAIVILGGIALDIQKDDRFTYNNQLYRVLFVRPNKQVCTQAEAELIE